MTSSRRRTRMTTLTVAMLMATVVLASCSSSSNNSASSATTSSTGTTAPGPTTTTTLEPEAGVGRISFVYGPVVGDCIDLRSVATGRAVTTRAVPTADATLKTDKDVILRLSCDLPHQYEVIAVPNAGLAPDPTPTVEQFTAAAKKLCPLAFKTYVGTAYPSSSLEVGWILPSAEQRNRGVQIIGCTAFDPNGKLTGSIKDSNR
ncbi:MAG: septum formation family protein [Acidimicrobiales bacterium]